MTDSEEQRIRAAIVAAYRQLAEFGLMQLSSGNLSHRLGDLFLITPTGADSSLTEDDIVIIDRAGNTLDGGVPSSEWRMHLGIYDERPDISAVVHAHGDYSTALACQRRPLPAFHYMVAAFGGNDVPCTDFAPFGSERLARLAAEALRGRTACLLANHGMICHGPTMATAAKTAMKLEMLVRQYLISLSSGEPVVLNPQDMAETSRRYTYYGTSRIPER